MWVKTWAFLRRCARTHFELVAFYACAIAASPALANSVNGAWLSPTNDNWPLVAIHAILTPDGRVLTYGSHASGKATGLFSYDI